ncbi:MAG TPA: guanylate kinase [Lachnospiraceae bacterium]|uniref:guanylate kinase n=1 Tax=Anaerosporobacter sp. TaxID=1872529 RepID=UPI000ED869D5|nr:guanylate kinase [Anaerosporobacter sp.]HAB60618.1 guanylate kinase [Lachnospiraceae bacterium]
MGKIYVVIGKSASGKDSIFKYLREDETLKLKTVVGYTTRTIRIGEQDGVEYFFVSDERFECLKVEGKIIEYRTYQTINGPWNYFTVNDGQIELEKSDYLFINTLEAYNQIRKYFGEDKVIPIYIEVEDGERLSRALKREKKQLTPNYAELCRRFLADNEDFSEEELRESGIERRFENNDIQECIEEIKKYINNDQKNEKL